MYIFDRYFKFFINKICGILLLVILILLAFFLGLNTANAETMIYNLDSASQTDFIFYYNCSSSSTCSTSLPTKATNSPSRLYFANASGVTVGTSGINIVYTTNQKFQPGYMYSINSYVCYTNATNLNAELHTGLTAAGALNSSMAYSVTTRSANNSSSNIWYDKVGGYNLSTYLDSSYCSYFSSVFSPNTTGEWVSLHLTRSSLSSADIIWFGGYEVSNLGAYNPNLASSITQVIENSATETQQQVQALNTQISEMLSEQEVTNEKLDDLNDKQEETNQKIDEVKDTITSDDTSGGESQGSSFFNDFSVNDNGGISGIITSPLRLINNLISGNNKCDNLSFNLSVFDKDKVITVDSGCRLWSKAKQPAVLTYHILLCGLTGYGLMIHLFKVIDKLKNPDESEVETLDL